MKSSLLKNVLFRIYSCWDGWWWMRLGRSPWRVLIKSQPLTDETLKIFIDIKLILDFNDFSVKDFIISIIINKKWKLHISYFIKNEINEFFKKYYKWTRWTSSRNKLRMIKVPEMTSPWLDLPDRKVLDPFIVSFVFSSISFLSSSFTFCSIFPHPYRLSWSWSLSLLIANRNNLEKYF